MENCAGRNREMLSAPVSVRLTFWTRYFLRLSTLVASRPSIPAYLLKPLDAGFIIRKLPQELGNANGLSNVVFWLCHHT